MLLVVILLENLTAMEQLWAEYQVYSRDDIDPPQEMLTIAGEKKK